MGTHFILVTIAIMALASTLVSALDPSPLQDFCVAINNSAGIFYAQLYLPTLCLPMFEVEDFEI
ncbi:hypothetical protein ACSBR1_009495 [Camellia fascicularis]